MQKQEIERIVENSTLSFKGEMTIQIANEQKEKLIKALSLVDHLRIDLAETTEADLSFLQLLYAAHLASVKMNKRLTISRCSEQFKQVATEAGYIHNLGCVLECEDNCFMEKGDINEQDDYGGR